MAINEIIIILSQYKNILPYLIWDIEEIVYLEGFILELKLN
jgi:hypothetical protein